MTSNDENISKLLRLKRYEQPHTGYDERFIREFRRRRMVAGMHRGFFERINETFAELFRGLTPATYAYASVLVLAIGISSSVLMDDPDGTNGTNGSPLIASTSTPSAAAPGVSASSPASDSPGSDFPPARLALDSTPPPVNIPSSLQKSGRSDSQAGSIPAHYVLQSRPVSYEAPFSF